MLEIVRLSFASLMRQRTRAFLTMFGIIWGIAAVIILVAIITGFKARNMSFFAGVGVNKLILRYSDTYKRDGVTYPLDHDTADAQFIVKYCPNVESASCETQTWREMEAVSGESTPGAGSSGGHDWFGVVGVTADYTKVRDYPLRSGRLVNIIDEERTQKVCVAGSRVAEILWGKGVNPVGQQLNISGVVFDVVGWLESTSGFSDFRVIVPYSTFENSLQSRRRNSDFTMNVSLRDPRLYDASRIQIQRLLAARHGFDSNDENAIRVQDFARFRDEMMKLFLMLFALVYFVGMMTLAVGAVGVTNIMLVNVKERTREIGLRKAMGATAGQILWQFIAEALILTIVGGIIGITFGLLFVAAMQPLSKVSDAFPLPVVTLLSIGVAAAVNILVGVIAGAYPAGQAAQLDPIVALRNQ